MAGKSYETDFIKLTSLSRNNVLRKKGTKHDQASADENGVALGSRFAFAISAASL